MKKTLFIGLCLVLSLGSCHKAEKTQTAVHESSAVLLNSDAKECNYLFIIAVGHSVSDCKGRCILVNGQWTHFECMSYGNACAASATVNIVQISTNNYTATTIDSTALTDEDFFNMPSRSLFVENSNKTDDLWLNIPAQLVFRDSVSRQFTFNNLYYSNTQVYDNE